MKWHYYVLSALAPLNPNLAKTKGSYLNPSIVDCDFAIKILAPPLAWCCSQLELHAVQEIISHWCVMLKWTWARRSPEKHPWSHPSGRKHSLCSVPKLLHVPPALWPRSLPCCVQCTRSYEGIYELVAQVQNTDVVPSFVEHVFHPPCFLEEKRGWVSSVIDIPPSEYPEMKFVTTNRRRRSENGSCFPTVFFHLF